MTMFLLKKIIFKGSSRTGAIMLREGGDPFFYKTKLIKKPGAPSRHLHRQGRRALVLLIVPLKRVPAGK